MTSTTTSHIPNVNVGLASKVDVALKYLRELGFNSRLTEDTYERLAREFNSSCLYLAIALCDITLEEKPLTVRRGLYRCATQGLVGGTDDPSYNKVQRLILKLRRKGFIPYSWISDSTRSRSKPSSWSGLQDFAETAQAAYRKDLWASQSSHLEVFTEKDAMSGVLSPITDKYDIHLNVIRGQCSESFVWSIAEEWAQIKKPIVTLYFGDHDPSGLGIEASLKSRMTGFLPPHITPQWERLAVDHCDFVDQSLLGLEVKSGDRLGKAYIKQFGNRCVEVDAISSNEIRARLDRKILEFVNSAQWESLQNIEKLERETISQILANVKESE